MKPKKDKSLCSGCYHNEYNHGFMGVKECWSFRSGKVIKRLPVPVDLRPPYNKDGARWMLSCFNRKGMVYVKPEVIDAAGYWKS
jgi:hypothetical protein